MCKRAHPSEGLCCATLGPGCYMRRRVLSRGVGRSREPFPVGLAGAESTPQRTGEAGSSLHGLGEVRCVQGVTGEEEPFPAGLAGAESVPQRMGEAGSSLHELGEVGLAS